MTAVAAVLLFMACTGLAWLAITRAMAWGTERVDSTASHLHHELGALNIDLPRQLAAALVIGAAAGAFAVGYGVGGSAVAWPVAAVTLLTPRAALRSIRRRRLRRLDDQLVDTLGLLSSALRAGSSLLQGIELVARDMPAPIREEFGRVVHEVQLGQLLDVALRRLADRLPLEELRLLVDCTLTLRETGGNLTATFDSLARTIVARKVTEDRIRTMTTGGMTQGMVACAFPIALLAAFWLVSPPYMQMMFHTPIGQLLLAVMLVMDAAGMWLMVKLARVDV